MNSVLPRFVMCLMFVYCKVTFFSQGGSASLEQLGTTATAGEKLKFSVTRHTPRQPTRTRPHIRVDLSPADEQLGKRIKLDNENKSSQGASSEPKKKGTLKLSSCVFLI